MLEWNERVVHWRSTLDPPEHAMRQATLILMLVLAATACSRQHSELQKALGEARAAEAQKDTLLTEVLETTQFVSDLNSELAKARSIAIYASGEDRGAPGPQLDREERKAALVRIQQVISRLNESEAKLTATEARAKSATTRNARLLAQISTYKKTIEDLKTAAEIQRAENEAIIADQRSQIALLAGQVDTLDKERTTLRGSVASLISYKNTVYYAVGTKDELLKKGIVTKEGSKFLIFGGSRLEPARNLSTSAFTPMDKTQTLSIALPRIDKKYKIVSRQSPEFLSGDVSGKGEVRGVIEIVSPEEFWSASKYLILVQD